MKTALIIVDVQNDFCEGGSLAVEGGSKVAKDVTSWMKEKEYALRIATRDYHVDPGDHFAKDPDFLNSWPVHCELGTKGVEYHPDLDLSLIDQHVVKGQTQAAYSGFEGVVEGLEVPLAYHLLREHIQRVDVCGLATDYCVKATVLDALQAGLEVRLLQDLSRGVTKETTQKALEEMQEAGAVIIIKGAVPGDTAPEFTMVRESSLSDDLPTAKAGFESANNSVSFPVHHSDAKGAV